MDLEIIKESLNENIKIVQFREHSKASEKYVDVEIYDNQKTIWKGSIPYYYRRTGLFIESEEELAEYLNGIIEYFNEDKIKEFMKTEINRWNDEMSGKTTTKPFFDVLINMKWNSVKNDLPTNPNWARRIQDIKEFGYTLATDTNKLLEDGSESCTHILLLPIPKGGITGYEIMSVEFKNKAIKLLNSINVFEAKRTTTHGLIPDHKFPEIRWDENTRENNEELSDEEIIEKFQLLDNQRNLQKREVCRKCFQTNERGIIYGIEFFYEGKKEWDKNIVKVGKEAEKGCIGCAWYDIEEWRKHLSTFIKN